MSDLTYGWEEVCCEVGGGESVGRGGPGPRGAGSIGKGATPRISKRETTGTYSRL